MTWYENYKWSRNPFVITPIPETFIIEDIRSKVIDSIHSGDILNLYGQTGTGKTSLLHALNAGLKRKFAPIYIDPRELPEYAVNSITEKRQYEGFLNKLKKEALNSPRATIRKILGSTLLQNLKATYKGKKLVLLIDEAKDILEPDIPAYLRSIMNNGIECAVIMTSIEPVSGFEVFQESLRDVRISYLQMRKLSFEEAKLLLSKRIESVGGSGIKPFDDSTLKRLLEESNYTPISVLKNAEEILKYATYKGRPEELKMEDIRLALMEGAPNSMGNNSGVQAAADSSSPKVATYENLTEMQKKIVSQLRKNPMTVEELRVAINTNNDNLFPDIYRLMLIRDAKRMAKKGITKPVISRSADKPAKYILDTQWKLELVRE